MNGRVAWAVGRRCTAGVLLLCLTWSIVVRYAEQGQPVHRELPLSFQTRADCLQALTSFRDALLASFTQQSFAGIFTLTGTVVSVWMNPDLTGIRRWVPWNYQAVRVKSACQETSYRLNHDLVKTQRAVGHKHINSTVAYLSFVEDEIDAAILAS
jgi:hypothetical protein